MMIPSRLGLPSRFMWLLIVMIVIPLLLDKLITVGRVNAGNVVVSSVAIAQSDPCFPIISFLSPQDELNISQEALVTEYNKNTISNQRQVPLVCHQGNDIALCRLITRLLLIWGKPAAAYSVMNAIPIELRQDDISILLMMAALEEAADAHDFQVDYGETVDQYIGNDIASQGILAMYTILANESMEFGRISEAQQHLQRILDIDPGNLYASYEIARLRGALNQPGWCEGLMCIDKRSLIPSHRVLVEANERVILQLWRDRAFGWHDFRRLLSVYTWSGERNSAQRVLETLLDEGDGNESVYYRLLGDVFLRRDRTKDAITSYRLAIEAETVEADAFLQLAKLLSERDEMDSKQEAAQFLDLYLSIRSEDILAQELSGQFAAQGNTDPSSESRLPLQSSIINLLAHNFGVGNDQISLGDNLISNGTFEGEVCVPQGWLGETYSGGYFKDALFIQGINNGISVEGAQSLRLSGIWIDESSSMHYARSEYRLILDNVLLEEGLYLFQLSYLTHGLKDRGAAIVQANPLRGIPFVGSLELPATEGSWRRASVVIKVVGPEKFGPFLSLANYGLGDVYFDEVTFRRISVYGQSDLQIESILLFVQ